MYRYRRSTKRYRINREVVCPFCELDDDRVIVKGDYSAVIRNRFPYDIWELRDVRDHLMVIPLRHVASLDELDGKEKTEIMTFMSDYGEQGYNSYIRAKGNPQKTVPAHQHTHLIAINTTLPKVHLYLRKPYWLFKK